MRNDSSLRLSVFLGIVAAVSYESHAIAVQPWSTEGLSQEDPSGGQLVGRTSFPARGHLDELLHRELRMLTKTQKSVLEGISTGEVTKRDVEVVLARFNEDIEWSDMYKPVRTLYCKGAGAVSTLTKECIPLPNVGRESHTYLHHLVTRYDSLANWTVFSQAEAPTLGGGTAGHMMDGVTFHDYVLGDGPFEGSKDGTRFIFNGAVKAVQGSLWYRLSEGFAPARQQSGARVRGPCLLREMKEAPDRTAKDVQFQSVLADSCFDGNVSRVTQALQDYVQWELGLRPDHTLFFNEGARFAVSRDRIHQRPKAFYQRLLDLVGSGVSSCTGVFDGWLWYYIMGMPTHSPC